MAKYQQGFPVNENGEIVVSSGNGGNTVSSTLPIDHIPVDDTTGGLKLANVAMLATDAARKTNAAKSIAAWHGINVVTVAGRQK